MTESKSDKFFGAVFWFCGFSMCLAPSIAQQFFKMSNYYVYISIASGAAAMLTGYVIAGDCNSFWSHCDEKPKEEIKIDEPKDVIVHNSTIIQ